MSETQPQPMSPPGQAPVVVNVQFVKDLSFEVPNAPLIYTTLRSNPQVSVNLDVQIRRLREGQDTFEVTLAIRADATTGPDQVPNGQAGPDGQQQTVFVAELAYSGVFTLSQIPENQVEPVLAVECARLLFPFARNILADVTREGGFAPVYLAPIDFLALWQSRRNQGETSPIGPAS